MCVRHIIISTSNVRIIVSSSRYIGIIGRTAHRYSYHWRSSDTDRRTAAGQTSIKHLPQRYIIVIKPVVSVHGRSPIMHAAVNNDKK